MKYTIYRCCVNELSGESMEEELIGIEFGVDLDIARANIMGTIRDDLAGLGQERYGDINVQILTCEDEFIDGGVIEIVGSDDTEPFEQGDMIHYLVKEEQE